MSAKKFLSLILILAITSLTLADNGKITVAGATQFDWFFSFKSTFPAATHDYIDVDDNGKSILVNGQLQQLAATYTGSETKQELLAHGPWILNYRGTGSGNGLEELVAYFDSPTDGNELANIDGTVNRWTYGASADYPFPPLDRIDIAAMDVPTTQFVSIGSQENAFPFLKPFDDGYGKSPITPWDGDSTNQLADLGELNINTANPDDKTIFDFPIGWYPFCFLASKATGLENITIQELQCLYLTGRSLSGINYNVPTRDSGSGTRNAVMSSIGVDPSWGRGDNLGRTGKNPNMEILGPAYQYNNIDSSTTSSRNHRNNRFMVSYQTLYSSKGVPLINTGWYECLNISFDGGKTFVRPEDPVDPAEIPDEIENRIDKYGDQPNWQSNIFWPNASNGWRIGGSETFATVGEPYATNLPARLSAYKTSAHGFGMRNPDAAAFIINITESIKAVLELGPNPSTAGSPGQALAFKSILVAGIYGLPSPGNPAEFVVDPDLYNPALTGLPFSGVGLDPYGSHGYGLLPNRDTNGDGKATGADAPYTDLNSNVIQWNPFDPRYALQGDINQNGTWDADDLHLAVLILGNGAAAPVDPLISYDVLCDFDSNGWFDPNDVRFMADGVILWPLTDTSISDCSEAVCRQKNFAMVDDSSVTGNFFSTVLAHGTYKSGDSRADIAMLKEGKLYAQAGAAPLVDGVVDQTDISYIQKVLDGRLLSDICKYQVRENRLSWLDPIDRVFADYSCDMNNDLYIDLEDLRIMVEDILETEIGDFDLNGAKDNSDRQVIINNMNQAGTYIDGDLTGDAIVDSADLAAFDAF
ncbi:MAG: hypothetical protein A2Z25_01800 [Planctomycetes bacterium RBG_16_55_9]|nr:MAG: hypothetical protein A2Z25_01800 [Planctomycetes bacterium RBG_16_55_9]